MKLLGCFQLRKVHLSHIIYTYDHFLVNLNYSNIFLTLLLDSELPIGKVIAIDLQNIAPISGVTILSQCDFTCEEGQTKLLHLLNGEKVNVVLSDMAPNATGIKEMDSDLLLKMLYKVLRLVISTSDYKSHRLE